MYEEGKLKPQVMRTFPMEGFAEALDLVASGEVRGKVVLSTGRSAAGGGPHGRR
jgi:NADPH:quinone reductase